MDTIMKVITKDIGGMYERIPDTEFINPISSSYFHEFKYIIESIEGEKWNKDDFWEDSHSSYYSEEPEYCICNHSIKHIHCIKNTKSGNVYKVGSDCVKNVNKDLSGKLSKKFNKLGRIKEHNLSMIETEIENIKQRLGTEDLTRQYEKSKEQCNKDIEKYDKKIDYYVDKQQQILERINLKNVDKKLFIYPEVREYMKVHKEYEDIYDFLSVNTNDTNILKLCNCNDPLKPSRYKVEDKRDRVFFKCRNSNYKFDKECGNPCKVWINGYVFDDDDYKNKIDVIGGLNPMLYYENLKNIAIDKLELLSQRYNLDIPHKMVKDKESLEKITELEKSKLTINKHISMEKC